MMTSTGRHLDETQARIPNAPSERADLYGQSYCERHQGQQRKGRTYGRTAPVWGQQRKKVSLTTGSFHIWESPAKVRNSAGGYKVTLFMSIRCWRSASMLTFDHQCEGLPPKSRSPELPQKGLGRAVS